MNWMNCLLAHRQVLLRRPTLNTTNIKRFLNISHLHKSPTEVSLPFTTSYYLQQIKDRLEIGKSYLNSNPSLSKDLNQIYNATYSSLSKQTDPSSVLLTRYNQLDRQNIRHMVNDVKLRHSLTAVEYLHDIAIVSESHDEPIHHLLSNHFELLLLSDHLYELLNPKCSTPATTLLTSPKQLSDLISSVVDESLFSFSVLFPDLHNIKVEVQIEPNIKFTSSNRKYIIVNSTIRYVLSELIKNAISATRSHLGDEEFASPVVSVFINPTNFDLVLSVCDSGGGLPSPPEELFRFGQSKTKYDRIEEQTSYAAARDPLQGVGVGLALSKITLESQGLGSLKLFNRVPPDHGCVATINLKNDPFPVSHVFKVIGVDDDTNTFESDIAAIVERNSSSKVDSTTTKKNGKFASISLTTILESQEQKEKIYREVSLDSRVKFQL